MAEREHERRLRRRALEPLDRRHLIATRLHEEIRAIRCRYVDPTTAVAAPQTYTFRQVQPDYDRYVDRVIDIVVGPAFDGPLDASTFVFPQTQPDDRYRLLRDAVRLRTPLAVQLATELPVVPQRYEFALAQPNDRYQALRQLQRWQVQPIKRFDGPTTQATYLFPLGQQVRRSRIPSLNVINADLVQIRVRPGTYDRIEDVIPGMVIKRGERIIKPTKSRITKTTVANDLGATKAAAEALFTFDFSAFVPATDITIVLIGAKWNVEWPIPSDELGRMR